MVYSAFCIWDFTTRYRFVNKQFLLKVQKQKLIFCVSNVTSGYFSMIKNAVFIRKLVAVCFPSKVWGFGGMWEHIVFEYIFL